MWLGLWCHCSQTSRFVLHPLTRAHWVPKQAFAELTAACEEANAVITSGELGWHKRRPRDTSAVQKGWRKHHAGTIFWVHHSCFSLLNEPLKLQQGPTHIHETPLQLLHSLKKLVFSPSCAHRIGIFCLSYIPVIFSLSALFITEPTLHFSAVFFTSPNS